MTEPLNFCQPQDEIEALVRSARDYVRPSDDLRPRVLETAHFERREQRAERRLWQLAAIVFLCGMLTTSIHQQPGAMATSPSQTTLEAGSIFFSSSTAARSGDPSWEMVETFTQLRRRQAQLLRL